MPLSLKKYSQSDGLTSYNIKQILKDKNDFLWVATQDGLSRFDGKQFIAYSKQSPVNHRLSGPDIRRIIEDTATNNLWILPNNNAIDVINTTTGNVVNSYPVPALCSEDWNITMEKINNNLWIGSLCGLKIFNTSSGKFLKAPVLNNINKKLPGEINYIAKDCLNNVWVFYSYYGIVIYNGKTLQEIKEIQLKNLNDQLKTGLIRVNTACTAEKYQMLLATNQGLRKIEYDENYNFKTDNAPCKILPVLNTAYIETISSSDTNNILVSGNGEYYYFNKTFKSYIRYKESLVPSDADWLHSVQYIFPEKKFYLAWLPAGYCFS